MKRDIAEVRFDDDFAVMQFKSMAENAQVDGL